MKIKPTLIALSMMSAYQFSQAAIITLAQDDFSGGTGDLGLVTADTGGQWQATDNYNANGTLTTNAAGGAAILAFAPTVGNIYTLTADTVLSSVSGYIGLGFANKNSTNVGTTWDTNVEAPNNTYRFSNVGTLGYSWLFNLVTTGNYTQNPFAGPGAGTTAITPVGASVNLGTLALKIVLDTSGVNWSTSMYVNNVLFAAHTYAGDGGLTAIDSVGFTNFGSTTGSIDNLLLTAEAVPEPGSALLGGLGALLLLRRRRH
jgi:MYXO-CTERM domain-containing protein